MAPLNLAALGREGQHAIDLAEFTPQLPTRITAVNVDDMLENVWIVSDPQECTDKIRQLHPDVGGFGPC